MSATIGVDSDATQAATRGLCSDADTFDSQASQAPDSVDAGDATALLSGVLAQVLDSGAQMNTAATTLAGLADDAVCDLLSYDADAQSRLNEVTGELQQ